MVRARLLSSGADLHVPPAVGDRRTALDRRSTSSETLPIAQLLFSDLSSLTTYMFSFSCFSFFVFLVSLSFVFFKRQTILIAQLVLEILRFCL